MCFNTPPPQGSTVFMIKAFNKHLNLKINEFFSRKKQLLVCFLLTSYCSSAQHMRTWACVCVSACVRTCIIAVNQPSQSLNLKFRLWLLSELIYMPLMSPPRCAFRPEAERTSLFSKFREAPSSKGLSLF